MDKVQTRFLHIFTAYRQKSSNFDTNVIWCMVYSVLSLKWRVRENYIVTSFTIFTLQRILLESSNKTSYVVHAEKIHGTYVTNLNRRFHLGDLDVDARILLKWILKYFLPRGLSFCGSGYEPVTDTYKHGNGRPHSIPSASKFLSSPHPHWLRFPQRLTSNGNLRVGIKADGKWSYPPTHNEKLWICGA